MAFQHQLLGSVSGAVAGVGAEAQAALHVAIKPISFGSLGHYRVTHRCTLLAAQVANARLFEIRNTHASNLIVISRLSVSLAQIAAGTAQIAGLDVFKLTGFTVVSATNTVTPTASLKRGIMAAAPGGAAIRGVTLAGAAAGMTGGTSVKDAGAFFQTTYAVAAAALTSNALIWGPFDLVDDTNGAHPFVFAQNEGLVIENRTLNTTSFGVELIVDMAWAEVSAY